MTQIEQVDDQTMDDVRARAVRIVEVVGDLDESNIANLFAALALVSGSALARFYDPGDWDGLTMTFMNNVLEIAHDYHKKDGRRK